MSRKRFSAFLLAIAALVFSTVFYLVLLSTTPSDAQTGGGTTGGDGNCPGARVVDVTTGTGNKQTPVFNITGTSFRITIEIEPSDVDPDLVSVTANVESPDEDVFTNFSKDGFGTDSSIINEGPGRFFLDLNTANAEYTVTTEDCTGTSQDGDITTEPSAPRPPPTPDPPPKRDVIRGTIPKKPLPPTGGLPVYVMVTGSILAGTGLLGLGIVIRRGSRR
ncbi:MAG: hypothetical protein H0T57_07745 [Rubrobacter sp.]|nr:hypothetical protein [Rubrobacter sp.]